MAKRYLLKVTDEYAALLEGWLGYGMQLVPNGAPAGIPVAGLDAITDEEYAPIGARLSSGGPLYHTGAGRSDEDREFDARTSLVNHGVMLSQGRAFSLAQIEALAEVVKGWGGLTRGPN